MDVIVLAGAIATAMFAISHFPMLRKAIVTRDLHSYSLGNLVLLNIANLIYSLYIFTLPIGPIWVLHSFYVAVAATMLALYIGTGAHRADRIQMRAWRARRSARSSSRPSRRSRPRRQTRPVPAPQVPVPDRGVAVPPGVGSRAHDSDPATDPAPMGHLRPV
ncbi:hypothetical protein ARHIZOSPH14_10170 [Agromyces rhizosphaerae]|uniref:PQ-loop repeat-containing protein n=1 Tax=Agromyces rhizosphaerae TaxID=88374 RepID=A0A9W6FNT8_9MICO|nr:hypothetical protein [Agromyces rhizosphaerae]GLI26775.1 hypothetical protein ARHIZOSPH14_10170 [Agromyces rhizosphaerae]